MMTVEEMEKYLKAMSEEDLIDCWNSFLQDKFPCSDARIIHNLFVYLGEDGTLYSFNTIDESPINYKELASYLVEAKKTREYID